MWGRLLGKGELLTAKVRQLNDRFAELDDATLASMAANGDGRALEALYDRYSGIVMAFSMRMLAERQAAEELTQEVFFRAWKQAGAYTSERGKFSTWLLSITHNMAIDELRKRKRRPQRADLEDPVAAIANITDTERSVEDHAILGSLRIEVKGALNQLPDNQRTPIELAYFRGYTQSEIARTLGEPLGTVKTRMRLGMRKLREQLEQRKVDLT